MWIFRYFQRICWHYSYEARFLKKREKLNLNSHRSLLKENADRKKIHLCFRSLLLFPCFTCVVNFFFFDIVKCNLKITCFSCCLYCRQAAIKVGEGSGQNTNRHQGRSGSWLGVGRHTDHFGFYRATQFLQAVLPFTFHSVLRASSNTMDI